MPRVITESTIENAAKRLEGLAEEGHYLLALEIIRRLEASMLRCHEKKIPIQRIWMALTDEGINFTRQHFNRAYRQFLTEKGLRSQRAVPLPKRANLAPGTPPPAIRLRRFPNGREIDQAVAELSEPVSNVSSSLDLLTKDL